MPSTPRSADLGHPDTVTGRPFDRILPWLLLGGGCIGFIAAFALTVEKFELANDPEYVPSCSLNPVLNCGSVMDTPQASVFGFPNSLLGIGGFAVIAAFGAVLLAGASVSRWFWSAVQIGLTAAVVFVHWLIVQSVYEIDALCPYCMVVWTVTVPMWWYVTLRTLDRAEIGTGARRPIDSVVRNHAVPLTLWFLAVLTIIAQRFWSYWSTLL